MDSFPFWWTVFGFGAHIALIFATLWLACMFAEKALR